MGKKYRAKLRNLFSIFKGYYQRPFVSNHKYLILYLLCRLHVLFRSHSLPLLFSVRFFIWVCIFNCSHVHLLRFDSLCVYALFCTNMYIVYMHVRRLCAMCFFDRVYESPFSLSWIAFSRLPCVICKFLRFRIDFIVWAHAFYYIDSL